MKSNVKKSLLPLLFIILFLSQSFAKEREEKSLLWKISGNGLEQESYLFGTIHLICQDQFKMDDRILNALNESKKIALEIDMSDQNMMMEMQRLSVNEDFKNIKDEFGPEQAQKVEEFLVDKYGVGLDQLGILKPFVLSTMILTKMMPCEEISGYEMFFMQKAQEAKIPMVGLESIAYQVGIFDQIPLKTQLNDIGELVTNKESIIEFESLVDAYLKEDLDLLYELITKNEMFQNYGDILLIERNRNWIPIIENLIKEESTFIAVGSGHLGSETGVIQLLRDAGYEVAPIN
ncbi:TraB/GumN family protein [Shivajiella indica]|uniref:TraB/GumN family protein n=1 Tax=Shivajiella indica TaxID=872115 RepID=A0ABW5BAI0_9BACT